MTNNTVTFTDLLRRAQAHEPTPADTWFWHYCDNCAEETRWSLLAETATQEIYGCHGCNGQKVYTVR